MSHEDDENFVEESRVDICSACNGSGEGRHDGEVCRVCGGSGDANSPWGRAAMDMDDRDWDEYEAEDYQ